MSKIPQRYLDGVLLIEFNSRELHGDSENDYLIKSFYAKAVIGDKITERFDIIIFSQVEVFDINEEGVDNGFIEGSVDIYKFPFPKEPHVRKQILRQVIDDIKATMSATPNGFW